MNAINIGQTLTVTLESGYTLAVTAAANSSGRIRREANSIGGPLARDWFKTIPVGETRRFGPFPTERRYDIECQSGSLSYEIVTEPDNDFATLLGNVEKFTGNITLSVEDNGKLMRCEDASNVNVTVPATLPEGFNIGFMMWGAGTVTIAAGSGATNRSAATALSTQYDVGSLIVGKNADGTAAEFVLGGGFA
jgi:hypothetical protein